MMLKKTDTASHRHDNKLLHYTSVSFVPVENKNHEPAATVFRD